MTQIIRKAFVDGQGRMHNVGDPVPEDFDKSALEHYARFNMIGPAKEPEKEPEKSAAPGNKKPAAPAETK